MTYNSRDEFSPVLQAEVWNHGVGRAEIPLQLWRDSIPASPSFLIVSIHMCPGLLSRFSHVQLFAKDCSQPGSSVHGILQARIPEWVAMPSSRRSSWHKDPTLTSCIAGRFFTAEPSGKPPMQSPLFLYFCRWCGIITVTSEGCCEKKWNLFK